MDLIEDLLKTNWGLIEALWTEIGWKLLTFKDWVTTWRQSEERKKGSVKMSLEKYEDEQVKNVPKNVVNLWKTVLFRASVNFKTRNSKAKFSWVWI